MNETGSVLSVRHLGLLLIGIGQNSFSILYVKIAWDPMFLVYRILFEFNYIIMQYKIDWPYKGYINMYWLHLNPLLYFPFRRRYNCYLYRFIYVFTGTPFYLYRSTIPLATFHTSFIFIYIYKHIYLYCV